MNHTNYRKTLAIALLLLILIIDLAAVNQLFENFVQVALFGAILSIQTLLILAYHQRCLECEGCMEKAGQGIFLFYKVFAAIGFFSMLIILLADIFTAENEHLRVIVALTYAALLITGVSTAFTAIIGVRNVANCGTQSTNTNGSQASLVEAKKQEENTLTEWKVKEEMQRQKSQAIQQKQAAERQKAQIRLEQRNNNRGVRV